MTTTKTGIVVNLQVEGVHCWPECDVDGVEFLKNEHRHMFHICGKKEVSHDDREIEIIDLKRQIWSYLMGEYKMAKSPECCTFGRMSCEAIARLLTDKFGLYYCSVLEDGENGAEIFTHEVNITKVEIA